jgi:hypothetical protein
MIQQSILQMSQIQKKVLKRAISILEGMKCNYVIIDPLGKKHGLLDVRENTVHKFRKLRKYPYGELSNYVRNYIEQMKIADVVNIPFDKYDALDLQASATSAANRMWEKGSVTTTINRPKQVLELMKIL